MASNLTCIQLHEQLTFDLKHQFNRFYQRLEIKNQRRQLRLFSTSIQHNEISKIMSPNIERKRTFELIYL